MIDIPPSAFATRLLDEAAAQIAPDGSTVHPLLSLSGGSMAHFRLAAGQVSRAVVHRRVEELWAVIAGRGSMWRRQGERSEVVQLSPGICISLPRGTAFQFRADTGADLCAVAVTMPPWPGDDEAQAVDGWWDLPSNHEPEMS